MRKTAVIFVFFLLAGCGAQPFNENPASSWTSLSSSPFLPSSPSSSVNTSNSLHYPITDAQSRVTKKPFGIHVSPSSSPVTPERFTGFHTGEDFETFENEQDSDVPITAICNGKVRFRGWVKGYGGVMIQECTHLDQAVTVLYGHLNIDSVTLQTGDELTAGSLIGNLGKGYSKETDGERKHLHLAIHKGTTLNYRGYVQTEKELDPWINPFPF